MPVWAGSGGAGAIGRRCETRVEAYAYLDLTPGVTAVELPLRSAGPSRGAAATTAVAVAAVLAPRGCHVAVAAVSCKRKSWSRRGSGE